MLSSEEVYDIVRASRLYQPLPEDVFRVMRLLYAPDKADPDLLCKAVEECPEFHTVVMKNMNSGFYKYPHYVNDLREAIVLLGYESLRNQLAYYLTVYMLPHERWERETFSLADYWKHAIAASLAADMLGERIGYQDPYRLFTYGLIHDIGFIVMEACLPDKLDEIRKKTQSGVPQLVAEHAVLGGVTHERIGGWVCGQWQLPNSLRHAVEHHHTPATAPVLTKELELLYLGNLIAERTHNYRLMMTLGRSPVDEGILASLGLTHQDVDEVDGALDEKLAKFHEAHVLS